MKTKTICIVITILVFIDQLIKIIINKFYLDCEFEIIPSILDFKPTFLKSSEHTFMSSLLGIDIRGDKYIFLAIIGLLIYTIVGVYIKKKKLKSMTLYIGLIISVSGMLSALIDRLFWSGTLDYVYLKPYFIFDLKDLYLHGFAVCCIIYMMQSMKKASHF